MWKSLRTVVCGTLFTAGACAPALAKEAPVYTGTLSSSARDGYDAVAYFTEHKAVKGSTKITTDYKGAKWFFASVENRDKFIATPDQYAPQYGGYCAWAISRGYTASGDPQSWKIVNNKLYLNYDASVQKKWEASIPEYIQKADANWPKLIQ